METAKSERFILVAENNQEHSQLIQQALRENPIQPEIVTFDNGNEVMEFLHNQGSISDSLLPNLIFLDLGIPGKAGLEVLSDIKSHPRLKRIPVIVLDLSCQEDDILRSYKLQGNCYVVKSNDVAQLSSTIKRIESFWLGIATLPTA